MILMVIGFVASATSTISLLPQIYRTWRLKSAEELSLLMLINFLICSVSWVAYGLMTGTQSVWVTNCIMTFFSIILLIFKVRFTSAQFHDRKAP
ncbi:SemiSWEET family sugar transporter [Candidatus Neptunochlamydia vexilliferae]|nr:SemiSWEET family transporter [Candidatus Neptunochlamydia vexilliferae]